MANPTDGGHGTQTATIGTEHSLTTLAVAATYQLEVDISAMAVGDRLEIHWKSKTLASGTKTAGDVHVVYGSANPFSSPDQTKLLTDYVPNINTDSSSVEFTLKQTHGTGRAFPWQVYKYA